MDAMGCQKEIAQRMVDSEADYLLTVEENQGRLYEDVRDLCQRRRRNDPVSPKVT